MFLFLATPVRAAPLLDAELQVHLHADGAAASLQEILTSPTYWDGAWQKRYTGQRYQEIRLKETPLGFIPMIAGEGGTDVPAQVVADVVFSGFDRLPSEVALVKRVRHLGSGHDDEIGADYTDTAFLLDGKLLYLEFAWRIYRRDLGDGQQLLWFEALPESRVPAQTLTRYQTDRAAMRASLSLRSGMFGHVIAPSELYGLFVVEPGQVHTTRVTFVARIAVGEDAGWIVQWGSQFPPVLRAAMRAAFDGAVNLSVKTAAAQSSP